MGAGGAAAAKGGRRRRKGKGKPAQGSASGEPQHTPSPHLLVRDGKAAGERMHRFYKANGVRSLPHVQVFFGSVLQPEALDASEYL